MACLQRGSADGSMPMCLQTQVTGSRIHCVWRSASHISQEELHPAWDISECWANDSSNKPTPDKEYIVPLDMTFTLESGVRFPISAVWKKQKCFFPIHVWNRQVSNFESFVWRTVSSHSTHHPQKVPLAHFSLYVHKGGLNPDSFHFISLGYERVYLSLGKVANTPVHIQGDDFSQ